MAIIGACGNMIGVQIKARILTNKYFNKQEYVIDVIVQCPRMVLHVQGYLVGVS